MKILFSPSEAKSDKSNTSIFQKTSLIFPELFEYRIEIFNKYKDFIQNEDNEKLAKLFGTKKQDIINHYKEEIKLSKGSKAINRYTGVAFKYLDYINLSTLEQKYIDNNVLIFSNLFGVFLAGDEGIPDYKLKQGEKINDFNIEKFYNQKFKDSLDNYLKNELILDLRAGFYEKFYKITQAYISMKFTKNNKTISHYSKLYRGLILNKIATSNINSIDDLLAMNMDNLEILEIKKSKLKQEIIYNIIT